MVIEIERSGKLKYIDAFDGEQQRDEQIDNPVNVWNLQGIMGK